MSASRTILLALVAALSISGAHAGRGASMRNLFGTESSDTAGDAAAIQAELQSMYTAQVNELANMVSTVFLAHHVSNLQAFPTLNLSSIEMATEMAIQGFINEIESFISGTVSFFETLPESIAGLPGNITDEIITTVTGQPVPTSMQANGKPEYSFAFHTNVGAQLISDFQNLITALQNPLALVTGEAVFSYAPCFVNVDPGGVEISATGVNIAPSLAVITPEGVNIQPQGLQIQPVLITIFPVGVNVQPQGLNIAPALIAVTPGRVSINPQGGTIGPALISVSAASP